MKASLLLTALLGAAITTAIPAALVADPQSIEDPTSTDVSGTTVPGPPVCGTCNEGSKKCCGVLVSTGEYGCFRERCPVKEQHKIPKGPQGLGATGNATFPLAGKNVTTIGHA